MRPGLVRIEEHYAGPGVLVIDGGLILSVRDGQQVIRIQSAEDNTDAWYRVDGDDRRCIMIQYGSNCPIYFSNSLDTGAG